MPMKLLVLALGFTAPTLAADERKARANLNISEMVSTQTNREVYRALKGYNEIYPFLAIEIIQLPLTEGDSVVLSKSWLMDEFVGAQAMIPLK